LSRPAAKPSLLEKLIFNKVEEFESFLILNPKKVIILKPSKANLCDISLGKKLKTLVIILKKTRIFLPLKFV